MGCFSQLWLGWLVNFGRWLMVIVGLIWLVVEGFGDGGGL